MQELTKSGGYTVPNFNKIAEAYGIRAASLASYDEIDEYKDWIEDDEPCLLDISLPEKSLLTPKIKFETGKIRPELDMAIISKVKDILRK